MTACALSFDIDTITLAGRSGMFNSVETLILLFLARFAAFRGVCQTFGTIERLLAGCPYERVAAVYTENTTVLKRDLRSRTN